MYKPCDFCSKDVRYCDCLGTCDFIPKYNLCPICKELTAVYESRCHKCGYTWDYTTDKKGSLVSNYCPNCGLKMESMEE